MNKSKKLSLAVIALFAIFALYKVFMSRQRDKQLEDNTAITMGLIESHSTDGRGSAGWFYYHFRVGSSTYKGTENDKGARQIKNGPELFMSKQFPVIYDRTNPANNRMLISPTDFESYGLTFPDSLRWVLLYVR